MRKVSKPMLSVVVTLSIALLSVLVACSGTLDLVVETTPAAVATIAALATENAYLATLVAEQQAAPSVPQHSPKSTPTKWSPPTTPPAEPLPVALVYRIPAGAESEIHVLEADGADHRTLTLPSYAGHGHYQVAGRRLAYTLDDAIYLADLADGTTRELYDASGRRAPDFDLCWSSDGRVLAYALAYEEADGSRMVELGTLDGYQQEIVTVLTARPAGPTPTPPPMPSAPSLPGFANLHLLGFDRAAGRIYATPIGGAEGYAALWAFDVETGERVLTVPMEEPEGVLDVALSPDFRRLAVRRVGTEPAQAVMAVYDLETGEVMDESTYALPTDTHLSRLYWLPDGTQMVGLLGEGTTPGLDVAPTLGLWVLDLDQHIARPVVALESPEAGFIGWRHGVVPDTGDLVLLWWLDALSREWHYQLVDVATSQIEDIPLPPGADVLGWASRVSGATIPEPSPTSPPLFTPQPTTTPEPAGG